MIDPLTMITAKLVSKIFSSPETVNELKLGDIIYDFTGASNLFTGSGITASANGIENIERGFNNYKGFDISEMRDYQNIKIFRFEVINDASKKIKRVYVKELNQ